MTASILCSITLISATAASSPVGIASGSRIIARNRCSTPTCECPIRSAILAAALTTFRYRGVGASPESVISAPITSLLSAHGNAPFPVPA
jgi:hypothetical protein